MAVPGPESKLRPPRHIGSAWNAADAMNFLKVVGVDLTGEASVTPEQVQEAITRAATFGNRLFRVYGWTGNGELVNLRVLDTDTASLRLRSTAEPGFTGHYRVAEEPAPFISTHGDCAYTLELVDDK